MRRGNRSGINGGGFSSSIDIDSNCRATGNCCGVAPVSIYPVAGGSGTRTSSSGRGDGSGSSMRGSVRGSGSGSESSSGIRGGSGGCSGVSGCGGVSGSLGFLGSGTLSIVMVDGKLDGFFGVSELPQCK